MKIKPLFKYILIEIEKEEVKTASGIILPDSAKEKPEYGKVIAKGSEVSEIKEGDKILFKKWGAHEVGDKSKLLIEYRDVLAIIENE